MNCSICGKKACVGFGSWPQSEILGLCKEHMTDVNIWRVQRILDVQQAQSSEGETDTKKREAS